MKNKNHTISVPVGENTPYKIFSDTKRIINSLGRYHRAIETKDYIFFVNYQESDENGQTLMYRKRDLELICDNYHASNCLFEIMVEKRKEITYLSPTAKINIKTIVEEGA